MNRPLLFVDTETGGFNAATDALLTVGLVAYDTAAREIVTTTEIKVHPDLLRVDPGALAVNNVDLKQHNAEALSRMDAAAAIARFVLPEWRRAQMVCHNSAFDKPFLEALLGDRFPELFFWQPLCTMQLAQWVAHMGRLAPGVTSLAKLCAEFGVAPGKGHTALADATATVGVYRKLIERVMR